MTERDAPSLNWIDRFIAYLSPLRGLARAQARLAYDGAKIGRRTEGWAAGNTSAEQEVGTAHRMMRDRARELVRNNPHASKAIQARVSNVVGTGILAQAGGKNKRLNARIDERWKQFIDTADYYGKTDLYGIQTLVERTRSEAGECLVRLRNVVTDDLPLKLQVLEPDFIDSDYHKRIDDRTEIRYGIEYQDQIPVAYYLFENHPGSTGALPSKSQRTRNRVDARELIHYYKCLRPQQTRGITDFAPVMVRLRALDDYDDAEVMRKKIAACLAAFVTTPAGLPGAAVTPTSTDADGRLVESFAPGMVRYQRPGEMVTVADPKPSGDYADFNLVQLRAIAAGYGIPYELISGDLSNVNYSSLRGGLVQFRSSVEADQWQVVIPQLCRPVWRAFLETAALFGDVPRDVPREVPAIFTPPRFQLLDPAREIPATVLQVQSGLDSYPNVIRREGYDWREKLDEIEEWAKELDSRKIVITSDARVNAGPNSQRFEAPEESGDEGPIAPPPKPPPPDGETEDESVEVIEIVRGSNGRMTELRKVKRARPVEVKASA